MNEKNFELVEGSGNVFRDFGDPDADVKQAKAILATRIIAVLEERGVTACEAGEITGYPAVDVSDIRNADLERFTVDRLKKVLAALDDQSRA